jgi:hypothetical protein
MSGDHADRDLKLVTNFLAKEKEVNPLAPEFSFKF